ncbi:hypothetical protein Bca4012_096208 [Brassica carinata]
MKTNDFQQGRDTKSKPYVDGETSHRFGSYKCVNSHLRTILRLRRLGLDKRNPKIAETPPQWRAAKLSEFEITTLRRSERSRGRCSLNYSPIRFSLTFRGTQHCRMSPLSSALKKEALCDSPSCGGYEFSYFEGSEDFCSRRELMRWSKQTWVIATFLDRICSICDEEGSGKTLEEEEASSLSLTQQDLLDSSGPKSSVVNHGVCDANSVVEGERGEATEPSNSSDDRRNTSEVAPQKEVVSFGKWHRLTNN